MTHAIPDPPPAADAPIVLNMAPKPHQPTRKVTLATIGAWVGGVALLAIAQAAGAHPDVLGAALPGWLDTLVAPLIPAAVTFLSGWVTKHAPNDVQLPTS